MLDPNWQDLYKAALFEFDPNKMVTRIDTARVAIAQQESRADITALERRKLADARSILTTLSRIASPEGDRVA